MATLAQNESASLDANYNQEFVDWTTAKFGNNAQSILTNVSSAREAATEFMKERLEPEIMQNYGARTEQTNTQPLTPSNSLEYGTVTAQHTAAGDPVPVPYGASAVAGSQESDVTGSRGVTETDPRGSLTPGSAPGAAASQVPGQVNGTSPIRGTDPLLTNGGEVNLHNQERNLHVQGGPPSAAMTDNYNAAAEKVREHAEGAGIPNNVAGQVAAQRSANSNVIRENGGKIDQNETPVQASSDILRNEHQGAVKSQQIGRTEEDIRQTKPGFDHADTKNFEQKLKELREQQRKAS